MPFIRTRCEGRSRCKASKETHMLGPERNTQLGEPERKHAASQTTVAVARVVLKRVDDIEFGTNGEPRPQSVSSGRAGVCLRAVVAVIRIVDVVKREPRG